jgi:hypothetical protein
MIQMTLGKSIKIAIYGAAAMLPATGAWALTPTQVNALTANNIIYVSGSTATDPALQAYFKLDPAVDANAPCKAGSYDLYKTATGYVVTCTAGPVFGTGFANTNFAFVKQTLGGSATGIHNVNAGIAPGGFPDLGNLTAFTTSCGAGVATGASSPFQAFNTFTCTRPESATIVPNAGISDEDPATFIGTGGVTGADATALTANHAVSVPFAAVVSVPLRNALQAAEGLTSGSETLANVPSLSSAQLRAVLSGQMLSLSDLWVYDSAGNATQVDPSGSLVHICRRGDTSGSEFATNIYLFGAGCSKGNGVGSVALPDDLSTQAAGATWTGSATQSAAFVFAGAGTGDVRSCVAAAKDPGDTVNYRIGFTSTDQAIVAGTGFRFVAVNGVAPTIWNIQKGAYDWLTEDTFNTTTASLTRNGTTNGGIIFTTVNNNLSNVNGLAGLNAASRNSAAPSDTTGAADTGIVTVGNSVLFGSGNVGGPTPANGWPAAVRAIATTGKGPNSPLTKIYPGQKLNNCNGSYQGDPTG